MKTVMPVLAVMTLTGVSAAQPASLQCLEGLTVYTEENRGMFSFDARGGYLATQGGSNIRMWDISDPESPIPFPETVFSGGFEPRVVTVSYPLVAATDAVPFTSELRIFDFSDPDNPAQVGTAGTSVTQAELVGQTAYVVDAGDLKVFDLSDPSQPDLLGSLPGVAATAMLVDADRLYLASGDAVRIIDISDPGQPAQIGMFPATGGRDIDVVGDTLYATTSTGMLALAGR